jgi:predicted permease
LLTEALVISAAGSALGLLFAGWAQSGIVKIALAHDAAGSLPFNVNGRVFAFIAGLCVLNALLFGLAPALRATRVPAADVLRSGRNAAQAGVARAGRWLIAGQIALSLALVTGAVLLLRTLNNLYRVDLGFNPRQVLMFTTDPRLAGYDGERAAALYRDLLQRARALPGAEAVSLILNPILGANTGLTRVQVPGYVPTSSEKEAPPWTVAYGVGPRFFATMRMPLVAGRDFTDEGVDRTGKVAIINETMAHHYFGERNPIGEKIAVTTTTPDVEIIGVAADTHYFGPEDEKQDVIFTPLLTPEIKQATVLVRTSGPPTQLAGDVRALVRSVDPNLPVYDLMSMGELLDDNLAQQRIIATLSAFFAALALVLSAIGIYGVLAYRVAQRTGEIGVRVALGATRTNIVRLVFRDTALMLVAGMAGGLALSLASAKLVRSVLFGVSATDIFGMAVACLILAAVALFASLVPTRRALRIDPNVALREE